MKGNLWEYISKNAFKAFFTVVGLLVAVAGLYQMHVPPAWIIVIILSIISLALSATALTLYGKKPDDYLDVLLFHFILPTDGLKPFYNLLIDSASKSLEKLANRNWLLVPRIPTSSFDSLDIWQKYESVASLKRITGGILLLADDPDENFDRIIASVESTAIPVVMVDVYFDLAKYDDRNKNKMPCFVGGNEVLGGQFAAQILIERIRDRCAGLEEKSKIVVVLGGNTAWELQRIESFKNTVASELGCEYVETEFLFYHRDNAFNAVYRLFSSMSTEELSLCSGIFAANDDMAIGARNAVKEVAETKKFPINVVIVGYDGTPEMKHLIDRGDEYLVGTVDVKITEQAEKAVSVMKSLVEGTSPRNKVELISPVKYTKI